MENISDQNDLIFSSFLPFAPVGDFVGSDMLAW